MEWIKTTFGELPIRSFYVWCEWQAKLVCGEIEPDDRISCGWVHFKLTNQNNSLDSDPVYRLVSPEREALEEIRPLLQEVVDTYNAPREISQNFDWIEFIERATAALEVKP